MPKGLPRSIIKASAAKGGSRSEIWKRAWRMWRGSKAGKAERAGTRIFKSRARSSRHMARRRVRHIYHRIRHHSGRRGGMLKSLEKVSIGGAALAPHIINLLDSGKDGKYKMETELWYLTGYAPWANRFEFEGLKRGYLPLLATVLAWKAGHKLNGLIRRL